MNRPTLVIPEHAGRLRTRGDVAGPPSTPATWLARSILERGTLEMIESLRESDPVVWSGSFAQLEDGELFAIDPRTWGHKGWAALRGAVESLSSSSPRVIVRPHARHVVSDIPGCRTLLDAEWARSRNIRLLYDPPSMLTDAMRQGRDAADHLRRLFEAIELFPKDLLAGVIVGSVGISRNPELDALMNAMVRDHVPESLPIVLAEHSGSSLTR